MDKQRVIPSSEWVGVPYVYPNQAKPQETSNNFVNFQKYPALFNSVGKAESNL